MSAQPVPVLRLGQLTKHYQVGGFPKRRALVAVDGIDLEVMPGETVALVGESGSGKSTVARCIVRLVEPTSGSIELSGTDVTRLNVVELSRLYRRVQMVFQDPNSSLNPRMSVRKTLGEPLKLHLRLPRAARDERARELLDLVGLGEEHLDRYPHQLSGGQRQRVGIARAIAVEPELVILDEPTSSLDVSVRGQVLDLLLELQERLGLAYLFITHDLSVVQRVAHRVAVMYLGGIVERGPVADVFSQPVHPYTRALLSAAPVPEWGATKVRFRLEGEIPSPIDVPSGCRLLGRCPLAEPSCAEPPALAPVPAAAPVDGPSVVPLPAPARASPLVAPSPAHEAACPVALDQRERHRGAASPIAAALP